MAHGLDIKVVAEGVETQEQQDFLKQNGCDGMQGYYFSKPLPAEQCLPLLTQNQQLLNSLPKAELTAVTRANRA
jgi:EAL domain-containing protein (putative c-di-GMP-specific phosphodiesterase class I)